MKVIFIIFIIVIIIFIHLLSKNIDNFKNYNITKLNKPNSDLNIYSGNINFLSNNNTINSDLLCIWNGTESQCIDFNEERNRTLPKPSGNDGVCNDDQCFECTCENGKQAVRTCTKKKSENDREQCVSCDAGYGLVNGKCVECTGNTYNNKHNNNECQLCSNLKCPTNDYPDGNPYYKRVDCGGNYKGMCIPKTCMCASNGTASWSCTTETESTCAQCDKGHKLTTDAGNVGARCIACEANTYQDSINQTKSCKSCQGCPSGQYRTGCGGSSEGTCNICDTCPPGQYLSGCGGTSGGSCQPCQRCPPGQYLSGCGGTSGGLCQQCEVCPSGQYRINCEGSSEGTCTPKTCNCEHGTAATGTACPNHNGIKCTSCNGGYYKKGNSCVPCSPACSDGYYQKSDCHSNDDRKCALKQCNCSFGDAARGTDCPLHGATKCVNCNYHNHYSLVNGKCVFNKIHIYQDDWFGGQNRAVGGYRGQCLNLHGLKFGYTSGKTMANRLSSFQKEADAKVTLFYGKNCKRECVDLSGTGNVHNVGSFWNDDVAAVGFNKPCPIHNRRALWT